jgi:hypothetical protein
LPSTVTTATSPFIWSASGNFSVKKNLSRGATRTASASKPAARAMLTKARLISCEKPAPLRSTSSTFLASEMSWRLISCSVFIDSNERLRSDCACA